VLFTAWHCPEILKVVLKYSEITPCPEFFCKCSEIFEHTCKWCISIQYSCESLSIWHARQRSTRWVTFRNIAFMSASGSGRPCPCEPQTQLWTLKTEGHTRTVTLLKVWNKQTETVHLYYWFWVTTVFLDDFNDTFSPFLHGFMLWKMSWNYKIYCPRKFTVPRPASVNSTKEVMFSLALFVC